MNPGVESDINRLQKRNTMMRDTMTATPSAKPKRYFGQRVIEFAQGLLRRKK